MARPLGGVPTASDGDDRRPMVADPKVMALFVNGADASRMGRVQSPRCRPPYRRRNPHGHLAAEQPVEQVGDRVEPGRRRPRPLPRPPSSRPATPHSRLPSRFPAPGMASISRLTSSRATRSPSRSRSSGPRSRVRMSHAPGVGTACRNPSGFWRAIARGGDRQLTVLVHQGGAEDTDEACPRHRGRPSPPTNRRSVNVPFSSVPSDARPCREAGVLP